jgi:hypothetical protein
MAFGLLALFAAGSMAAIAPGAAPAQAGSTFAQAEASTPQAESDGGGQPLVVVGVTGLTWTDVSPEATPNLDALVSGPDMAVANLLVRSARAGSCPAEGWLALNTGQRTPEVAGSMTSDLKAPKPGDCGGLAVTGGSTGGDSASGGSVAGWDGYLAASHGGPAAEHFGDLGQWLGQAGLQAAAIGPGAALALAGADGQVTVPYQEAPDDAAGLAQAVTQALAQRPDLLVVDAGMRSERLGPAELDARIGAVLDAAPGQAIVASVADYGSPAMGVVAWRGFGRAVAIPAQNEPVPTNPAPNGAAHGGPGLLRSNATRQAGLVQVTELQAAIKAELVPKGNASPWAGVTGVTGAAPKATPGTVIGQLTDMNRHAQAQRAAVHPGFIAVILAAALTLVLGAVALVKARRVPVMPWAALAAGCFPAAGFVANLVDWWRLPWPVAAWLVMSLALAAGLGWLVRAVWRRLPGQVLGGPLGGPALVGAVTALTLAANPLAGGRVVGSAPLGTALLHAARFYGFGNPAFALFGTGVLLAMAVLAGWAWLAGRRAMTAVICLVVTAAGMAVVASPAVGADFGGSIAVLAGGVTVALVGAKVKLTWRRGLAVVGGAVLAGVVLAVLDYARGPGNWTHVGGFVQRLLDGQAMAVIQSKASLWLRLSAPSLLVLGLAALAVCLMARRGWRVPGWAALTRDTPMARAVMVGVAVMWLVGSLVNDSGFVIAALGVCLAGPLAVAALLHAPTRLQ